MLISSLVCTRTYKNHHQKPTCWGPNLKAHFQKMNRHGYFLWVLMFTRDGANKIVEWPTAPCFNWGISQWPHYRQTFWWPTRRSNAKPFTRHQDMSGAESHSDSTQILATAKTAIFYNELECQRKNPKYTQYKLFHPMFEAQRTWSSATKNPVVQNGTLKHATWVWCLLRILLH